MCLQKQDSDYALGPNMLNSEYGKVLNMAGFSICERYAAF